jgi:hypothetical protein
MNCKHVQELLPLYVGRDLEETRAQMVTAHVQSCVVCAGSVDDYRETRQLIKQFAPPPVSEAVYAGIRRRVLREIEQEAAAPGLSRLLDSLFRPRLRWAVATALVLAVSVSSFYFIAKRKPIVVNDQSHIAGSNRIVAGRASTSIKERQGVSAASIVKNKGPAKRLAGGDHQSPRKSPATSAVADQARSVALHKPDTPSMAGEILPTVNSLTETDAVPARDSGSSGKTLRMEMQTKDPNIRIIWFAPQPTKQDSQGKFPKGT